MDILDVQLSDEELQAGQDLLDHIGSNEKSPTPPIPPKLTPAIEPLERLPIKIIIKIENNTNENDFSLLRNSNHVTSFMITSKPKYPFWKSSGFFLYIKNRAIPKIHSSFPFNTLQQNNIPYELDLVKALYKDQNQIPISIIPNTPQSVFSNLPTPNFILDSIYPAELNLIFKLNPIAPKESEPTNQFLNSIRNLALKEHIDSLQTISDLIKHFQIYKFAIRSESSQQKPLPLLKIPINPPDSYSAMRFKPHHRTPYSRF